MTTWIIIILVAIVIAFIFIKRAKIQNTDMQNSAFNSEESMGMQILNMMEETRVAEQKSFEKQKTTKEKLIDDGAKYEGSYLDFSILSNETQLFVYDNNSEELIFKQNIAYVGKSSLTMQGNLIFITQAYPEKEIALYRIGDTGTVSLIWSDSDWADNMHVSSISENLDSFVLDYKDTLKEYSINGDNVEFVKNDID